MQTHNPRNLPRRRYAVVVTEGSTPPQTPANEWIMQTYWLARSADANAQFLMRFGNHAYVRRSGKWLPRR